MKALAAELLDVAERDCSSQRSRSLRMLMQVAATATPDAPAREVKEMIAGDEPISAVVILQKTLPVGLVMNLHLDKALSRQFGLSMAARRWRAPRSLP